MILRSMNGRRHYSISVTQSKAHTATTGFWAMVKGWVSVIAFFHLRLMRVSVDGRRGILCSARFLRANVALELLWNLSSPVGIHRGHQMIKLRTTVFAWLRSKMRLGLFDRLCACSRLGASFFKSWLTGSWNSKQSGNGQRSACVGASQAESNPDSLPRALVHPK